MSPNGYVSVIKTFGTVELVLQKRIWIHVITQGANATHP